jgi:hypothetical protein
VSPILFPVLAIVSVHASLKFSYNVNDFFHHFFSFLNNKDINISISRFVIFFIESLLYEKCMPYTMNIKKEKNARRWERPRSVGARPAPTTHVSFLFLTRRVLKTGRAKPVRPAGGRIFFQYNHDSFISIKNRSLANEKKINIFLCVVDVFSDNQRIEV